ncbi:triose-phosphate isomerase [Donghicola tyrosinivorans]|uniref:Triosephosphate isomerase n=1 Tax=Donghicola tyrosinivorans TaxID=1652492 RepID=A0A2T0X568_9RHOB|nr:triose-phosphate isomerase [Donghicola tyrosinivorans]PRY94080.1 triosephosphate isomerase [Donghicola tyrosinivorans]
MRRKFAAGNWKMNGTGEALSELNELTNTYQSADIDIAICPPATLVDRASEAASGSAVAIGGQDCHANTSGAHTGDISADMLRDAGATYVIVGHSERREDHGESSDNVADKATAAYDAGLIAIVCIGESLDTRNAGDTLALIGEQLAESLPDSATGTNTVIAYEPIWAIGTGLTPTLDQIAEVHDFMRDTLAKRFGTEAADAFRLLYGGSVKPGNAAEIFATSNVDGALVGGASLKASDFSDIIDALAGA